MFQVFEIPLVSTPQRLSVTLNGVSYNMLVKWCDPNQSWTLDILDSSNSPLVQGIPLVTGVDLLGQYGYLGIGGQLIVQTDNDTDMIPTFTNLGNTSHLYFRTQ